MFDKLIIDALIKITVEKKWKKVEIFYHNDNKLFNRMIIIFVNNVITILVNNVITILVNNVIISLLLTCFKLKLIFYMNFI